jgi:hypothetical protein
MRREPGVSFPMRRSIEYERVPMGDEQVIEVDEFWKSEFD